MIDQEQIELLRKENESLKRVNQELQQANQKLQIANQELKKADRELQLIIQQLQERIVQLEHLLKLDSQTSSKPPSSDGLGKRNRIRSLRSQGTKPNGGQKGHEGYTIKQVKNPDHIIVHSLRACPNCTRDLSGTTVKGIQKRQVIDIPPIKATITEHQTEVKYCTTCRAKVSAAFPAGVTAPVQYGEYVKALVIYLKNQQLLPQERLRDLLADVFNLPISTGTLAKINSTFSDRIGNLLKKLKSDLIAAPVKHMDETGFRIEGRTQWLHVLCDETGTYYQHSPKRGAVFDSVKEGTVVHDHYRSYYKQLPKVKHALCNAHHLRELKALIEIEKESWAGEMWKLLNDANSLRQKHKGRVPQNLVEALSNRYDRLVQEGLAFHDSKPPLPKGKRGSRKRRIGHNLLRRFLHNKEDTLRFMYEAKVPFTNNQAERDIRMMKVQQKISGCFRTLIGASIFCRIKSFLSTVIKRGLNVLQAIRKALQNNFSYLTLSLYRQQ